jgi:hypothetical protein
MDYEVGGEGHGAEVRARTAAAVAVAEQNLSVAAEAAFVPIAAAASIIRSQRNYHYRIDRVDILWQVCCNMHIFLI